MRLIAWFLIGLIQAYRWLLSPVLPASCRFWPTCSSYAQEALARHGPLGGGWLALRRLLRCHPWCGGGYDPVPERSPFGPPGRADFEDQAGDQAGDQAT